MVGLESVCYHGDDMCMLVLIIPAGCDGCHGDRRGRVCRGSSYPSFGTFPGLWPSPMTGSQSCHPREVWHPHIHTSQGITNQGGFQLKKFTVDWQLYNIFDQSRS